MRLFSCTMSLIGIDLKKQKKQVRLLSDGPRDDKDRKFKEQETGAVAGKVAKAAGIIMFATLLSRLLGFVREAAIGAKFGQNQITDSYIAAFTLPDFLYFILVGGAISTAFIPVLSSYISTGKQEEGNRIASSFINLMLLLTGLGIIVGEIFTPYLIPLVAYDFKGETLERTIYLTRIMFPSVIFTGLAGLSMGVLNTYNHFLAPAIGAVMYNVVIIACGLLFAEKMGIAAFAVGVVLGAAVNFLVQVPALYRTGFRYRLTMDINHPGLRRIALLMVPALIGLSIVQMQDIITQNLASSLEAGSITALRFANRLMQLPLGVFAIAISIAVFPTLTACAAQKDWGQFRSSLSLGLRAVIFITMPAAVGMAILRLPIVEVLFQYGKFDHIATSATASVLLFFLVGLFAQGANQLLPRVFYAVQKPGVVVRVSFLVLLVNGGLGYLLKDYLGAEGLAVAFSAGAFLAFGLYMLLAKKVLKFIDGGRLTVSILQTCFASGIMALVLTGASAVLPDFIDISQRSGLILFVLLAVALGAIVYSLVAFWLNMQEMHMIMDTFLGRLFKKRSRRQRRRIHSDS